MNQRQTLWLKVTVPIASFAVPQAREFVESYPFPPPTTVYGMLLSMIGETNRSNYRGAKLAILVQGLPSSSILLRKMRRFKKSEMASDQNSKPDFQEVLTEVVFYTGIQHEPIENQMSLVKAVHQALTHPEHVNRFGGLSCGESHNLVDQITIVENPLDLLSPEESDVWALAPSETGDWSVALWADHIGLAQTKWVQASFAPVNEGLPNNLFFTMEPRK